MECGAKFTTRTINDDLPKKSLPSSKNAKENAWKEMEA